MKHLPEAWLDRVASDHMAIDAELRQLIRQAKRREGRTTAPQLATRRATRSGNPTITLAEAEVRALLRGTMPILPQRRAARARHARLWAALAVWQHRVPALALDPIDENVLAAARQLADALDGWIAELAWRRATSTAGVSWAHEPPIRPVTRQSTEVSGPDLFDRADEARESGTRGQAAAAVDQAREAAA